MTNEIRVFQSPEFETIRVLEQNGEPWFVAVDVCRALEISNSRDALSRLEDDEKMTVALTDSHSSLSKKPHCIVAKWLLVVGEGRNAEKVATCGGQVS